MRTHAVLAGLGSFGFGLLQASMGMAQQPDVPPPNEAPAAPAEPQATPAPPVATDPAKPSEAPPALDPVTLSARLDRLQQAFDELKAQQEAAAAAATPPANETEDAEGGGEPLRIYGFMDMGVQRNWINEQSALARLFQVNNTSFVVGNVNLYFDAQPMKHFRGLAEVRFTNAPLGDIANYGGIAGTFQREDTFSYDPGGTALNAPMWGGKVVLERAWLEWNEHQSFKLRIGNYFTPFGIWNEDHGTPTLISLALPQFIVQRWMPIRQTGVMVYGNTFASDWELGYVGTFSNGRQEISNYNFDNNFGFGGRLYARRDTGELNVSLGLSYFTGETRDEEVDVVVDANGINGLGIVAKTTVQYIEHVAGADASLDIDATRIRAEAVVRRLVYEPGKRAAGDALYAPGSFTPDTWQQTVYVLVANQLPWGGIEPYLFGAVDEQPTIVGDFFLTASAGVNVHFNSSVQWKTQATRAYLMDRLLDSPYDPSINNVTSLYSRLVMAF